jgi:hypothetical protein
LYRNNGELFLEQEFAFSRNDTDYFHLCFYPPIDSNQCHFEVGAWGDFPFKDYSLMSISRDGSVFLLSDGNKAEGKILVGNLERPDSTFNASINSSITFVKTHKNEDKQFVFEWSNSHTGNVGFIISKDIGFRGFFKESVTPPYNKFGADLNGIPLFE